MKTIISILLSVAVCTVFFVQSVSAQEQATPSGSLIKIYAAGTSLPSFNLIVKDSVVATFADIKGNPMDGQFEEFQFQANESIQANQVKVRFINDSGTSRDLRIDKITIDGVEFQSETASTYTQSESVSCKSGFLQIEWLYCNSSFQYDMPITPTPTSTPVPTVTPTPTVIFCAKKAIGDADCNDKIDIADFEIWRREFTSLRYTGLADFDKNGNVTVSDYEIWRKTFYAQLQVR